jgi:4,5-dihydroxyphthalate decarboxylase
MPADDRIDGARLKTLLGNYPWHAPLKRGDVRSPRVGLDFTDVPMIHSAFKRVVRDLEFDVAELALVTFLQAKAWGKPLSLVPIVLFNQPYPQHGAIVYSAARETLRPQDLSGKRVGARALSVTTVMWVRGILQHDYGVDLAKIRWVTCEDAHVAEARDAPGVERAEAGASLLTMLVDGALDAAILAGAELADPRVRPMFPNAAEAEAQWARRHGFAPINHLLVLRDSLAREAPWVAQELVDLLRQSRAQAGLASTALPAGLAANREAVQTAIDYALEQHLLPRRLTVDELVDDATRRVSA